MSTPFRRFYHAHRQTIVEMTLGFVLALIIVYSGFINTLIAFLLIGAIPGTSLTIPPLMMLALISLTALMTFGRAIVRHLGRLYLWEQHSPATAEAPEV